MSDKEKRQRKKADCLKKGKEWRYNAKLVKPDVLNLLLIRKAKAKVAAAKRKLNKVQSSEKPVLKRVVRRSTRNRGRKPVNYKV